MRSFVIVIRSAYFGTQKRRNYAKCVGVNRSGHGGHLGHVTSIMSSNFYFLVPESFHKKFGSDRHISL